MATALIRAVEAEATVLALPLRLAIRTSLEGQRAYYERLGFKVVGIGTHAGFTEPTYFKMRKELE